ncbi:MAG: hypothetical protein O9342_00230 [Beijerinckiaceae bacterium]|nr:hypothetical protein [Beijerinckiaceae bacterium]
MSDGEKATQPEPVVDGYYNPVFQRLVDAEGEHFSLTRGMVAYGIYKLGKREWIQSFVAEKGRRPTPEEVRGYAEAMQTETQLGNLRSRADQVLGTFAQSVIADEKPRIVEEALRGSFMQAFWPSFVSSVVFAVLLIIIGLFAAMNGIGIPIPVKPIIMP